MKSENHLRFNVSNSVTCFPITQNSIIYISITVNALNISRHEGLLRLHIE